MKVCAIFLILGALTACSSTPQQVPNCDIPPPMEEVGHLLALPELIDPISATETTATFNKAGLKQLKLYNIASTTNKKVGDENTLALEARNEEVNALIECARWQNVWMEVHAEDLKEEKLAHFLDNVKHQVVILVGVIAVLL